MIDYGKSLGSKFMWGSIIAARVHDGAEVGGHRLRGRGLGLFIRPNISARQEIAGAGTG